MYAGAGFRGSQLTGLLRDLAVRDHLAAIQLIGEDLPQAHNRVDLDPRVRDLHGFPVARITHTPHAFERSASAYFGPQIQEICRPGRSHRPDRVRERRARLDGRDQRLLGPLHDRPHHGHGSRMGDDPRRTVTDRFGRLHGVENVHVADGRSSSPRAGSTPR